MLDSLHIENVAVIKSLDIDFSGGLSVITGETGAGKSVMIDALSFLLGARPARELLRSGEDTALVSAVFTDVGDACLAFLAENGLPVEEELLLQRTLGADGKMKCRLNGRVITQSLLRELAGFLVSIHGQNENHQLLCPEVQSALLDSVAALDALLPPYRAAYDAMRAAEERLAGLKKSSAEAARLRDIYAFQVGEIDAAHLKLGEEEELLQLRSGCHGLGGGAVGVQAVDLLRQRGDQSGHVLVEHAKSLAQTADHVLHEALAAAGKLLPVLLYLGGKLPVHLRVFLCQLQPLLKLFKALDTPDRHHVVVHVHEGVAGSGIGTQKPSGQTLHCNVAHVGSLALFGQRQISFR